MLFNSIHFLIFLPIVVITYFMIPPRYRWLFLLIASYYMYMSWNPAYGLLLFAITVINFYLGIYIEGTAEKKEKKTYLYLSLASLIGPLFLFKYFNFFNDLIATLINGFGLMYIPASLKLFLPVGISFHTFQILGYMIDLYNGRIKAERHLGIFALYVSFFPQLLAGPIERAAHLLPQFLEKHQFKYERTVEGLRLILWGFFKKIVIADSLAIPVSIVYGNPTEFSGFALALASVFFAIQIYADFSGYTDIARGSAKLIGFELTINFNKPFGARSISDFWQRWHISLTSWFQDYVFKPLYFFLSRRKQLHDISFSKRHFIAFSIATIVGLTLLGLWHGAGMNYVIFGLSQAIFIILYHAVRKWWDKIHFIVANAGTLLMVLVGFIFFRAETVSDGIYILTHTLLAPLELLSNFDISYLEEQLVLMGLTKKSALMSVIIAIMFMQVAESASQKRYYLDWWKKMPRYIVWGVTYLIILWILLFGFFDKQPFIYFDF